MPTASVKERPIIFSAEMVRAILRDEKTMTRRVIKNQLGVCDECWFSAVPHNWNDKWQEILGTRVGWSPYIRVPFCEHNDRCGSRERGPYEVGMRLWVREAFQIGHETGGSPRRFSLLRATGASERDGTVFYRADGNPNVPLWRPSIHMPRWASRITIEVTDVRIERLQEINEEDATAEGVAAVSIEDVPRSATWNHRQDFAQIWDKLNAKRGFSWELNPWVDVVSFRRVTP